MNPFALDLPPYASALPEASRERLGVLRRAWREAWKPDQVALMQRIDAMGAGAPPCALRCDGGEVVLEVAPGTEAPEGFEARVHELVDALGPWKKGPFRLLGEHIDAEWRSDHKWDRVVPHVALEGKRVCDIGSHNGYFMVRMADHHPELVVGLEPVFRPQAQLALLQALAPAPQLASEPLGIADIDAVYPGFFDTVLCLGILYHHTDPVGLLRKMALAMKPGGELVVDCQGIPGDESLALVPQGRYCGASGIWWLPTATALMGWMRRAGYRDVELFYSAPLSVEEQRPTAHAAIKSLADFLDPADPSRTVEGYPAPWRHYVKARRG